MVDSLRPSQTSTDVADDPINVEAAELMAKLHDALAAAAYDNEDLGRLLTRVLFCLFAEHTLIFQANAFTNYIETKTHADGRDLGPALARLFEVLHTPTASRQTQLSAGLRELPHVHGELFAHRLKFAAFDSDMRAQLLRCAQFDWSAISPALFGSIFQGIMDRGERRQLGAHYTSEADIMKLLRSLFLDELEAELGQIHLLRGKHKRRQLSNFHDRLASLRFIDPACGCGNFLILAYRELRRLEHEILVALPGREPGVLVEQFHGIELLEFPAAIARVSMRLMEQQMNIRLSAALAQPFLRPSLVGDTPIHCANALRIDWGDLLPPANCAYVIGNPPFAGKQARSAEQAQDMQIVFGDAKGTKTLDYACAWYKKAADYIKGAEVQVAYVSTNSITQGEQPGVLWPILYGAGPLQIVFAHRSFPWRSEARGKAQVHVVIIGFSARARQPPRIYEYDSEARVHICAVESINPYLVEGQQETLSKRRDPLDPELPRASFGNMPNDGGHLLLTEDERLDLIRADPGATAFIRPLISAKEFLAGEQRWCIWLHGASPAAIRRSKPILARVQRVKAHRQRSTRPATRRLAELPAEFGEIRQPEQAYLLIPRHPSHRRHFVPIGYFGPSDIVADSCICVPGATPYHFGVLSSTMHNAWLRQVGGRIKSDLRYSIELVYNNFPWPPAPSPRQRDAVERCADRVLELRQDHSTSRLADLYSLTTMPSELATAHRKLDAAVDRCYGVKTTMSESDRISFLFSLWRRLT